MWNKKTHEQFVEEVKIKGQGEYEVLGKYKGNGIKVLLKHISCGHEYEVVPYSFLNGRRCPKCRSLKKSPGTYRKDFEKECGYEYKLLSEYKNARTRIKVQHTCGEIYEVIPNRFLKKQYCPKCLWYQREYKKRKTIQEIKSEVDVLYNGEYAIVSGEYENRDSNLRFKHLKCGTEFETRFHDFKQKKVVCNKCKWIPIRMKNRRTFYKRFEVRSNGEYELLSDYTNSWDKILVRHNECDTKFEVSPNNFLSNLSGCPLCSISKGEKKVHDYLVSNGIHFLAQHKFEECKNILPLPFDFYLPQLNTCIEYDGELHFKDKGINDLPRIKLHDEIKNEFCSKNNIKLLRIPYWEFDNIEKILSENIKTETIPSEAHSETVGTCND